MTDKIDRATRSRNMSRIRSRNTRPELKVRRILHKLGYRFRLHRKDLPGRPDVVLPKHRVAIFINGCFWHRHVGCREASRPKSNTLYWETKLNRNVERDSRNHELLGIQNWKVVIFWECELEKDDCALLVQKRLAETSSISIAKAAGIPNNL